ncbi:MAG TPA: hypothetical protein PK455_00900 [Caldisericia bacterium]|nr:hypothetical protein [Caldisericia bacterium]
MNELLDFRLEGNSIKRRRSTTIKLKSFKDFDFFELAVLPSREREFTL